MILLQLCKKQKYFAPNVLIAARLVRILHKKISTKATHDAGTQIHETNGNITNLHYAIIIIQSFWEAKGICV